MPAARRTGIELYPDGCRLVEVAVPSRRDMSGEVRVHAFATNLPSADNLAALTTALQQLRTGQKLARRAWVTVWGLRAAHQYFRLPPAKPGDLETLAIREARREITPLESSGERAGVALVIGGESQAGSQRRREVAVVAASAADVRRRIQPIIDAGFDVEGVVTVPLALAAVARSRQNSLPGIASVCVALTAPATCIAIVRDGAPLFSRELPFGYGEGDADAFAERLTSELKRSLLYFKQTYRASAEDLMICGDMPRLRELTAPLGESLGLRVQPLDALVGIDAINLPEPADDFRHQVAALRLGIATAAEPSPRANVLPSIIARARALRADVTRTAIAAAASLVLVAGGYAFAARSASGYEADRQRLEQEIARLEPEARRLDALREAYTLANAQRAALDGFATQGPRLARFLELLSQAPDPIMLTSVAVRSQGTGWLVTVTGRAVADEAVVGQAAVNNLIATLSASPFAGEPVGPPSLRMVAGGAFADLDSGSDQALSAASDRRSGVEFTLQFQLDK